MPDFTMPKIRLHTVNIREQFVAPLMDGKLKAITRLNGRGYNAGDCIRFSVCPVLRDYRGRARNATESVLRDYVRHVRQGAEGGLRDALLGTCP